MKQLTGNEQKAVAQRAKQQMDDVRKALEEETNQEQYRQFLQHWSVIEAGYKSLLKDYLRAQGKKINSRSLQIRINQAPAVLRFAGVEFDAECINLLFKSNQKIGMRGARGIRNALVHKPTKSTVEELSKKYPSLIQAMEELETAIVKATE